MDKNTTRRFKTKVFNRAFEDEINRLDAKQERLKMFYQILFWGTLMALVVMLVGFGISGIGWAIDLVQYTILGNVVLLAWLYFQPRIFATFKKWKYAAELHKEMGGFDYPSIKIEVENEKGAESPNCIRLVVWNYSKYPLKECYVKIANIEPPMNSYTSGEVILDWDRHFINKDKIDIGTKNPEQQYVASAVIMALDNIREEVFFATVPSLKERRYIGDIQKYRLKLELHGKYLWEEFKEEKIIETYPKSTEKSKPYDKEIEVIEIPAT